MLFFVGQWIVSIKLYLGNLFDYSQKKKKINK